VASALSNLFAVLSLDSQPYLDSLGKTKKKTDSFMASFVNVGGAVAAGLFTAVAGGVVILGKAVDEAIAAEEVSAKLNATLANTGKVSGVTAEMVDDLANQFQNLTRFEDDTIKAGGEVLARFDEINKDVFPEALSLSLDLATRLGIDVPAASELLGKALADPGVGLMKLKAAGVVFNDEQEKMIDTMMQAGDQGGAMALIMDVVSESVGGSAEAAGSTAAGMWERLKNQWGNILEQIGTGLLPAITQLGQTLMEYLNRPEVQVFVASLADAIADFATTAISYLPQVFTALQQIFGWLGQNKGVVVAIFAALGAAAVAWGVTTAAAAISAMAPFLPVIAVIALIAGAVYLLYQAWTTNFGGIQEKTKAFWAQLQPAFQTLSDWLGEKLPVVIDFLVAAWNNFLAVVRAVWSFLQTYIFPILMALNDLFGAVFGLALKLIGAYIKTYLWEPLKMAFGWIADNVFPILQKFYDWLAVKLAPVFKKVGEAVQALAKWISDLAAKINSMTLPSWMTPGSPTPWELGLLGVGDAMRKLARTEMPAFRSSLELQANPVGIGTGTMALGGGAGMGGGVWWWSTAVNVMPMLLLGGVSVGHQVVSVVSANVLEVSQKVADEGAKVSEKFPNDWRKVLPYLSQDEVRDIAQMSTKEIREKYHLQTAKTAQNWRGYAQKEVEKMARVQS
jgi:hypothetical protein